MQYKQLTERRKFLAGLGTLAVGCLFFGYKAFSKNPTKADSESLSTQVTAAQLTPKPIPASNARMGINFSGVAYWASELPFADLMHQSGEWVSQPPDFGKWGTGPQLMLDQDGWVVKLEKGCHVTKILCAGGDVNYPSGTYVMLYEGEGEIELMERIGSIRKVSQGRLEVDVDSKKGMFAINIVATNPNNYLRNIRVIVPGLESSYQDNPWHPAFLKRWAGVACIRMMDMMATNHSTQMDWQNRPKPDDVSYAQKGVPVELLVDLANRLDTDVWFCMPHLATNDYVEQFAIIVKNSLKPHLHAWVEYSNEIWNGAFDQYKYAEEQGLKIRLSRDGWQAAFLFNAKRSVEIFKVWENVFGSRDRFICVIACQAANEWHANQLLKVPDVAQYTDVLAIAPYINNVEFKKGTDLDDKSVGKWSLDKLFTYINAVGLPQSIKWMHKNKRIADEHGVKFVAYEAGQHLVGIEGAENNNELTRLFLAANQDVRMGEVYAQYLNSWESSGGDLICLFNSTEKWSRHGSWGLLQHYDDKAADSPKFKAVMDWAKSRGQTVSD